MYDDFEFLMYILGGVIAFVYTLSSLSFLVGVFQRFFWLFCSVDYLGRRYTYYMDIKHHNMYQSGKRSRLIDKNIRFLRQLIHCKEDTVRLKSKK